MAIDTPARIAVLGAGPIGLEAALYARFLGYDVEIFERGRVAENVQRWGHARMFAPFSQCRSTLGLAALAAHDEAYVPPKDEDRITGREWVEQYLAPLARTDLLADHLRLGCEVLAIGKDELLKGDCLAADLVTVGDDLPDDAESRGDYDFRLLVREASGLERIHKADAVLDASGTYGSPSWLGQGGIPAVGEISLRNEIEYGLPDVLGAERARYAGRHTLVIGSGLSAATTIVALAQLATESPGTRVTWLTRRAASAGVGPVANFDNDPFPERQRVSRLANEIACTRHDHFVWHCGAFVDGVRREPGGEFVTILSGTLETEIRCDQIVANVGCKPDMSIYRELQTGAERIHETISGVALEPNFYILGEKTCGRRSGFAFQDGLAQIREVFATIGDRPTLDLYANAQRLVREAR